MTAASDGCLSFRGIKAEPEPREPKPRGRPRGKLEPEVLEEIRRVVAAPTTAPEIYRLIAPNVTVGKANFYRILDKLEADGAMARAVEDGVALWQPVAKAPSEELA